MTRECHVIPIGGKEPEHVCAGDCWCYPLEDKASDVWVHNAKDLREVRERNGTNRKDELWALIEYEVEE